MNSFDPIGRAVDWLDAYRAASLAIVDLYADDAALECGCTGQAVLYGRPALLAYWRRRFTERPAGELADVALDEDRVVVSYRVPGGVVQAALLFDGEGRIARSQCGPTILPPGSQNDSRAEMRTSHCE